MRLVIDLQSCQNGAAHDREGVLAQARALAQQAGQAGKHTVLVAMAGRHAEHVDALRHAFDGVLPPERVLSYGTPAPGTPWSDHAARQLRLGFLASLDADAVYMPGVLDHPQPGALADPVPSALNVAGIGNVAVAPGPLLEQAALVFVGSSAEERRLGALLPKATVVTVPLQPEAAATRIWAALENAVKPRTQAPVSGRMSEKPRLAYISPLPPEKSGIADYSAEVIAELEAHYAIELVLTPGAVPDASLARFPVRDAAWFMQHGDLFDRIVYHFGNSNYHKHMFALLERHPGIVVLHDFYLSGVLDNMERDGDVPEAFLNALYASHGHTGMRHHAEHGRNPTIWAYPCNLPVLKNAAGVIVHSDFSKRLAERWYGPGSADGWRTLPLLRGGAPADPAAFRAEARQALGVGNDDYIVSAFGMLGATKLNDRLLDAFLASPLAQDPRCRLVFVGENESGPYGRELARRISELGGKVRITGFVSGTDYARWLAASDTAVQLRAQTRGETSASVLDCLLYGVATVINAHGASADLPGDVLVKLSDEFATEDLAAALARLHADAPARLALGERARAFVASEHGPAQVGRLYVEAIEHFARHARPVHYRRMLGALAAHGTPRPPNDGALVELAGLIAGNAPPAAPRQLLVDISALVQTDHKTGIQRVVRSVLLAMLKDPPPGYRVEPVYSEGGMRSYRYARGFTFRMTGGQAPQLEDAPVELAAGDIFLGLDLASNITTQNEALLLQMRRRGVRMWFVVYDLLPLLLPHAFPYGTGKYYGDYVNTITLAADGIVAISRSVAQELHDLLASRPNRRATPLKLGYFHLGADIDASAPSAGLPPDAEQVLAAVAAAPTLLMVGTLEPRKGQAQALAAFDLLWERGVEANLVIVGKNGWLMDALAKRLETHPQRGTRLFWLPGVSDEMLTRLYANCAALLAASEGEGFGLPLIEAAQKCLPVIARDIPVFREVAGEHAFYFDGKEPAQLASAIKAWLALRRAGSVPASSRMPWLTWQQSAQQLVDAVVHGRTHASVEGGDIAPQLLVDVSAVARDDLKTGIQRVVRAQLFELLRLPTTRFQVHPVYLTDEGDRWHYRYARRYEHALLGTDDHGVVDDEVRVGQGDVFYAPDFFPGAVTEAARTGLYTRWRAAGVSVNFLIHDLLPVLRPEYFPPRTDAVFESWMKAVAANGDRLICISGAVADETRDWLQQHMSDQPLPELAVVHHGADIDASRPSTGLPDDAPAVLADIAGAPSFLMVGTIEPRKGHMQALDAFEQLWADGVDVRLVIVGGEGWKGLPDSQRRTIPAIMARLAAHPELGKRLHWLRGITDEYLEAVYRASACLLVPSEGEGFGLPLIEAARHDLPVIARDIPVFREVAGDHAHYFDGTSGGALAASLREWLALHTSGSEIASAGMAWQTWASNARQLADLLFGPHSTETPA
ncbi:glycosyltransferase [Pseudoduganella lutea]|uniref:Glycosyltransferase n=1 Tax=Pseudoduganella lutea TaxID=321985 RepID=A0A4P6L1K0_9BURK|nr:glycosyltransferase [Pseudoduganella lutea]QBE64608.1 glycosyltransferase [Pseudoduganella lutea]